MNKRIICPKGASLIRSAINEIALRLKSMSRGELLTDSQDSRRQP